jgi:hypothetical protein
MARLATAVAIAALALLVSGAAGSPVLRAAACPRGALPLAGINPIGPATAVALRLVPARERPQVRGANFAWPDVQRGGQIRYQCGAEAARRTVIVYILRRAYLPALSASTGVYFVSRFANGYRVWQVAH